MIPTGVASAVSVFAASKVPFYVAGGVLALWAVALAAFGITRPGFPRSNKGRRGVIAASLVLVAAAMASAVATAGEEGGEEAAATSTEMDLATDPSGASSYDRTEGTVKAGAVTIHLTNESSQEHNVAVADGDRELGRSDTIAGEATDLRIELGPGEYAFYCTVDAHRASGMEGTLTVR